MIIDLIMCILLVLSIALAFGCLVALEVGDRKKAKALNNQFWASAQNGDRHYTYNKDY